MRVINLHRENPPRDEPYIYIGRPSKFGYPFSHGVNTLAKRRVPTRGAAIMSYERWIRDQPELMTALVEELDDDTVLGCWCEPLPCHGRILIKLRQGIRK